ncbi:GNAT family N-acetyltransferase [Mesorhizobium sp. IMUNJ 23232]|uniref:GNAT family N-acetyltransferase n=1 Tax=Mesorhizobium sp. IMUNJ 23232 TaxID=3376064 RepID=UPI0037A3B3C9
MRRDVFIDEQGVSEQEEIDELDDVCTHVLATSGGTPVGAARFRVVGDAVKIQRVCVSKEFRGKGAGAALIGFIVSHVRHHRLAPYARLGSQTYALEFYRNSASRPMATIISTPASRIATCSWSSDPQASARSSRSDPG